MKSELFIKDKPKSNISEDIRTIRTNLMFTASSNANVIMITSTVPGEGKTFVSSNLAAAFASNNESTLLIDCDLRLGRVHKLFEISNDKGFSNLLVENDDVLSKCAKYIKKTNVSDLYVIPRGSVPPNPSELLSSNNALNIINFLRSNFNHIILDSVPIKGLPDGLITSKLADKVVIVTSVGVADIDELENTKKALENVNANIAGVVVNRVKESKKSKYYNYYDRG